MVLATLMEEMKGRSESDGKPITLEEDSRLK